MEIKDWLRSLGDRARLLVVIPLAAALVALLIGVVSPAIYRASATLVLPGINPEGPVTPAVTQAAANFTAAVQSDAVRDAVSAESGVPASELSAVTVSRSGQSNVLNVGFTGTDPEQVPLVVAALTREALRTQAEAELNLAVAQADAARQLFGERDQAYIDFGTETGAYYTDVALEKASKRVIEARDKLNGAVADGDAGAIQLAQDEFDLRTARLTEMQTSQTLFQQREGAFGLLLQAEQDVNRAEGDLTAAEELNLPVTRATALNKITSVAQKVVFAATFGLVLAVGLLVLLALLQGGRNLMTVGEQGTEAASPAELSRRRAAGGQ